jgi:hypothetical protein
VGFWGSLLSFHLSEEEGKEAAVPYIKTISCTYMDDVFMHMDDVFMLTRKGRRLETDRQPGDATRLVAMGAGKNAPIL